MSEIFKHGFGIFQIRRIKPLGEPALHRGEQIVGVLALVLALPQTGEASPE